MTTLAVHDQRLDEHGRRLDVHDGQFEKLGDRVTNISVDVAKAVGYTLAIFTIVSALATAGIVHYLTPSRPAPVPAQAAR